MLMVDGHGRSRVLRSFRDEFKAVAVARVLDDGC